MVNYATLGSAPVSEVDPCGESVRYDADFEALEAEVGKQESLSGGAVDWPRVVQLASDILGGKSKDLLVAAYLSRGLLETRGVAGLADGLKVINDMLEHFWEGLFPPVRRARARASAVQWLAEQAGPRLSEEVTAANAEQVIAAEKLFRNIDSVLAEQLGDHAPVLTDLSRPLHELQRAADYVQQQAAAAEATPEAPAVGTPVTQTPAPAPVVAEREAAPQPPPTPAPPSRAAPAAAAEPTAPVGTIASEADAKKALRGVQDVCRKVAAVRLQERSTDPRAYRMARIATWLLVDQPPPHNDGVTQLQPPPAERRKQLAGKVEQRQFGDVIPELEQTLARAAFWFDGQRLVASVLQAMGADYAAARDVVIAEVGHVLRRLPELLDLKFADGTPFADAQTRMWLQNEVLVAGSEDERGAAEGEAAPWDAAAAAARAALMKGDAASAFASFEQGLAGSSGRNRLCWRLSLASLLVQSGRAAVAVPLLEAAEADLQRVNLEEWEPNLCASLYRLLVAAYAKAGAKNDDAKRELAYARLCSLDPINAMQTHED